MDLDKAAHSLLFIQIVLEIWVIAIWQLKEVKGNEIRKLKGKISLFDDDMKVYLSDQKVLPEYY